MNIVNVTNGRPGKVEIFLAQPSAQQIPANDGKALNPALTLPITNSKDEFGQHTEDNPRFACIRCPQHIYKHAIRFWRTIEDDGTVTIYYLAAPNLTKYKDRSKLTMKPAVGNNPIHLKIYASDTEDHSEDKMIGIVGEMVSDIISED